jgi:hypothetical protein
MEKILEQKFERVLRIAETVPHHFSDARVTSSLCCQSRIVMRLRLRPLRPTHPVFK